MVADNRVITEVQGVVSCVSGTGSGLKLQGSEAWINVSKYASVTMPPKGSVVVLGLDKSGYIREITTAQSEKPMAAQDSPIGESVSVDKDRRITRMAALNTATAILTTHNARGGVEVDDVLLLTERLESWVTR